MKPLLWAAAAAIVFSCFFSLNGYALRYATRRELEPAFGRGRQKRVETLLRYLIDFQMLCALLRVTCNFVLLVTILYLFEATERNLVRIVAAVCTAAGLLAVFGVAIPHAWARHAGAKVLTVTGVWLLLLRLVLWPVVMLMRFVGVIVARIGGDLPGGDAGPASRAAGDSAVKAEIIQVASEAQARGAVADDEVAMIESVVEFGDLTAGEIMTPRTDIVAVSAAASPQDARRAVVESGHTRLPVYEGGVDNVIGILHGKDLLAVDDLRMMDLRKMLRPPFFVPETKHLGELLREFKAGKLHMAIVLDEYGGTAGLVTIEDLLEEIVGEIADEYDLASTPLLRRIDERTVETDGRLRIAQLNDALGLHLPEGRDYDTVAGLVFSELGFIPPVGETLSSHGAKFTVIGADARKITRVRVELPGGEET